MKERPNDSLSALDETPLDTYPNVRELLKVSLIIYMTRS